MLITIRLSIINLAATARTDVAVGTESDASMLATTRADTPLIGSSVDALGVINTGAGLTIGSAGVGCGVAVTRRIGCCVGADACATGACTTGALTGGGVCFCALGTGGTPLETGCEDCLEVAIDTGVPGLLLLKYSTQAGSTDNGSAK